MKLVKDMERIRCHDCGVEPGEFHLPGCDTEQCPKCGRQIITCSCFIEYDENGNSFFNDEKFDKYETMPWTGIMYENVRLFAEEHDLFVYWNPNFDHQKNIKEWPNHTQVGWIKCDKNHPDARHSLNDAIEQMPKFIPILKKNNNTNINTIRLSILRFRMSFLY